MNSAPMNSRDVLVEETLVKQARRLQEAFLKETGNEWSENWSKEVVARLYHFEHWHMLAHHLRQSIYRSDDVRFQFTHLHPETINSISPLVLPELNKRKIVLANLLEGAEPNNSLSLTDEGSDVCDRLIIKMYGFKTISEFSVHLKYHFHDHKISLLDQKSPHLIINEEVPGDYFEAFSELLIYQQDYAPIVAVAPRDHFESDITYGDVGLLKGIEAMGPFTHWSMRRLYNWFANKLRANYANYIHLPKAISLSEIIAPLFIVKSPLLRLNDLMRMLSLDSLIKYSYSPEIPKQFKLIISQYIDQLPGYVDGMGYYGPIPETAMNYHNQTAMLITQMLADNTVYFDWIESNPRASIILSDAENLQSLNTVWQDKSMPLSLNDALLETLAAMSPQSMLFIKVSKEKIDTQLLENIKKITGQKKLTIVWWCSNGLPLEIENEFKCNKLNLNKDKNETTFDLELLDGSKYSWRRNY